MIRPLHLALRRLRHWVQRLRRGWDDSDTWSLDVTLAQWTGPRLVRLSEVTDCAPVGYPDADCVHTDIDAWVQDVRWAGEALSAYGLRDDGDETVVDEAEEAMQWVGRWWRHLWW